MKELIDKSYDPDEIGQVLRQRFLNKLWFAFLLIAVVALPASLTRAFSTGWLLMYTFHAVIGIIIILLYLARRKLSYHTLSVTLLSMIFLIGVIGVLSLGLLGAGLWWLIMCSFLTGSLISHKAGMTVSAVSLAIIALAGYIFTTGIRTYPVDVAHYVVDPTSWISFLIAVSLLPFVIFQEISGFQQSTLDLLIKVNKQKIEIERLEAHDQLTGLPLLRLAGDRLQMAINNASRSGRKVALLFIDLDGFKAINDTFGHEAGDNVLKEVGVRMLKIIRNTDTAARIGGDEFILILPEIESEADAAMVTKRIIDVVTKPIAFAETKVTVGVSIGIAFFPDHAEDANSLRRAADKAMYSVKKSRGNSYSFASKTADL